MAIELKRMQPGDELEFSEIAPEVFDEPIHPERLEAYLPLFIDHSPESKRQPTIDRVRMVYLKNAVAAPNPNLVLIVFSYYSGYQIRQNGAGSGPPGDG